MRKQNFAVITMFVLAAMTPGAVLLLEALGWRMVIQKPIVCVALGTAAFAACFAVAVCHKSRESKCISVLLTLMPILTAIDLFFCMFYTNSMPAVLLAAAWVVLSLIVLFNRDRMLVGRMICLILVILLIVAFANVALIWFTFGQIGSVTVTDTVHSPAQRYRAEVVCHDQGALGGDTSVQVYQNQACLRLWLLRLEKKPQWVYRGEWGEHEYMQIHWESEQTLIINGKAYPIS